MTLVFLHPSITAALLQRNRSSVHLETFLSTHHLARCETNLAHQQLKQTSDDDPRILTKCKIPWMYREITQPSILSSRASLTINRFQQSHRNAPCPICLMSALQSPATVLILASIVHLTTMWCLEPSECQ